ncbi:hypothetical protein AB0C12_05470 [Actinoplanes sp. NPDC048967]|uniref:hypothetical protein n=1 Tax=Actinoplanes sp. NPDC048967 TaxID=3155269 RepID=UPI0033C0CB54
MGEVDRAAGQHGMVEGDGLAGAVQHRALGGLAVALLAVGDGQRDDRADTAPRGQDELDAVQPFGGRERADGRRRRGVRLAEGGPQQHAAQHGEGGPRCQQQSDVSEQRPRSDRERVRAFRLRFTSASMAIRQ